MTWKYHIYVNIMNRTRYYSMGSVSYLGISTYSNNGNAKLGTVWYVPAALQTVIDNSSRRWMGMVGHHNL